MPRTETTTSLLREVARLHMQAQREGAYCCSGTSTTQCTILTELGRHGPMTLAELGRRLDVDKGWVSRAVESMAQDGLLAKVPGETDRRTITISLTELGEERHQELDQVLNDHSERVMARIPAGEREGVYRALGLLRDALRAELNQEPILIQLEDELR